MIEATCECGQRERFALATQIVACVLDRAPRAVERDLAALEAGRQADRRKIGQRDRSAGNAATTVDNFKPEAVREVISLCLVHLHEDVFAGLRGDLALGVDLRPIEDAGVVVEIAAGCQQVSFGKRLIGLDRCDVLIDQTLLGVDTAERKDIARKNARAFVDVVDDIDMMRIVFETWVAVSRKFEVR